MARGQVGLVVGHGLGVGVELLALGRGEGPVDVEPEVGHYGEVVPELAGVFFLVSLGGEEGFHCLDDGVGASCALVAVVEGEAMVDHALDCASVFGEHEAFELCIVIEHLFWIFLLL